MTTIEDEIRRFLRNNGLWRHARDFTKHHEPIYNVGFEDDRTGTTFVYGAALIEESIVLVLRGTILRPGVHFTATVTGGSTTIDLSAGTKPRGAPGVDGEFYIQSAEVMPEVLS